MTLETTDPTLRMAWAIVCGYVPDSDEGPGVGSPADQGAFVAESFIADAVDGWHSGVVIRVGVAPQSADVPLAQMVEANAEDWYTLAWLASAEVGDVEDGYHSERMERVS